MTDPPSSSNPPEGDDMKPHTLRKVLWWADTALLAAVLAAVWAAWGPARDAPVGTDHAPMLADFARRARGNDGHRPKPPVAREEILAVFRSRKAPPYERAHFPFTGPMPPALAPDEPPPAPRAAEDLSSLGEPTAVLHVSDEQIVLFAFKSGTSLAFRTGEWIRESRAHEKRYRFLDVQLGRDGRRPRSVHLKYGIHAPGKPSRTSTLSWSTAVPTGDDAIIRDVTAAPPGRR